MPPAAQPDLPLSPHGEIDSMLSRKFGKEVANYFSGSPLNRVAFLRTDHTFLTQALHHPSTTFILFKDLNPLLKDPATLATVPYSTVKPLVGENPYLTPEAEQIAAYNSSTYIPTLIFLGLDPAPPSPLTYKSHSGAPVFALDVTPRAHLTDASNNLISSLTSQSLSFSTGRHNLTLPPSAAALYASARHLLDWNTRNPFCAQCGSPTLSTNAGWKRTCPPSDTAFQTPRPSCVSRGAISNICFPRTDPTVIMAVISASGDKILLGRQNRWPAHWYSTLAGFLEPAESVEEAVRREVWEESGVRVGRVVVHSTQPWPYPANLMIGAVGQALPDGEAVDLGNDPELEDARWFELAEVREALRVGTSGLGEEAGPGYKEGGLRLPPRTAIAHQLLDAVVNGGFLAGVVKI
ncbi:hypothetical protein EJ06DRAFT_528047 [Trichodelitschia bisporula]|uniref:NAD(+) diphosphatase n=1 Tax=Trichodelitschia bisporula TaxID=703511 RepID=A0A6G1I4N7_9PEZI|nr:hypothetical protein EJ06DRAFT_528047 [Trichodelitschia bisporula]